MSAGACGASAGRCRNFAGALTCGAGCVPVGCQRPENAPLPAVICPRPGKCRSLGGWALEKKTETAGQSGYAPVIITLTNYILIGPVRGLALVFFRMGRGVRTGICQVHHPSPAETARNRPPAKDRHPRSRHRQSHGKGPALGRMTGTGPGITTHLGAQAPATNPPDPDGSTESKGTTDENTTRATPVMGRTRRTGRRTQRSTCVRPTHGTGQGR